MRDGSEDICTMCSRTFDAISVVDTTLPSFMVNITVLQIVVKVDGASTQVSTQESHMCHEDGGDAKLLLPAERNGLSGLPFVEMRNNGSGELPGSVLSTGEKKS